MSIATSGRYASTLAADVSAAEADAAAGRADDPARGARPPGRPRRSGPRLRDARLLPGPAPARRRNAGCGSARVPGRPRAGSAGDRRHRTPQPLVLPAALRGPACRTDHRLPGPGEPRIAQPPRTRHADHRVAGPAAGGAGRRTLAPLALSQTGPRGEGAVLGPAPRHRAPAGGSARLAAGPRPPGRFAGPQGPRSRAASAAALASRPSSVPTEATARRS